MYTSDSQIISGFEMSLCKMIYGNTVTSKPALILSHWEPEDHFHVSVAQTPGIFCLALQFPWLDPQITLWDEFPV